MTAGAVIEGGLVQANGSVVDGPGAARATSCLDVAPIQLTLGDQEKSEIAAGQTVRRQATGVLGCTVEVAAVRGHSPTEPKLGADCEIVASPLESSGGDAVEVRQTGDCEGIGVSVRLDSRQSREGNESPTRSADSTESLSPQWVDARTIALDVFYYPMVIVSSQINWQYDGYDVYEVSYPIYQEPDCCWYLVFSTEGSSHEYPPVPQVAYLQHYFYTHWYSDGFPNSSFPDTEAWIQPTAYGYATGGWSCSYYHEWGNQYPGTSFQDWCNHYP